MRVRPGATADRVGGRWEGPRGPVLLVTVRARPVEDAANAAVVRVLAAAFAVRRQDVRIVSGARGRDKLVEIEGDPNALNARLAVLVTTS